MMSTNFSHAFSSTWWKKPKYITWDFLSKRNNISVYIDGGVRNGILHNNDGKLKFLWLLESRYFDGGSTFFVKNNLNLILDVYTEIWTHSLDLLELSPKFKWVPAYGTYVENINLYSKNRLLSMISSDKRDTEQQRFRYDFAKKNKDNFDLFGRGFKEIKEKEQGLVDYMFSIAIENDTYDTYFTEKILDCFATGTIPIYKGTKQITNHFNEQGILFLDDINLTEITEDLYFSKIEAVKENLEKVLKYDVLEDWIYENYLHNYTL